MSLRMRTVLLLLLTLSCLSACDGQRSPEPSSLCVDECGNGQCQELVCMGSGCPCAESNDSCPQDCAPVSP